MAGHQELAGVDRELRTPPHRAFVRTAEPTGVRGEHHHRLSEHRQVAFNDPTALAGDRLRAMEQLESRALGNPKETVEHQDGKSEVDEALDRMSTEELEAIARQGRHLRAEQSEAAEH